MERERAYHVVLPPIGIFVPLLLLICSHLLRLLCLLLLPPVSPPLCSLWRVRLPLRLQVTMTMSMSATLHRVRSRGPAPRRCTGPTVTLPGSTPCPATARVDQAYAAEEQVTGSQCTLRSIKMDGTGTWARFRLANAFALATLGRWGDEGRRGTVYSSRRAVMAGRLGGSPRSGPRSHG